MFKIENENKKNSTRVFIRFNTKQMTDKCTSSHILTCLTVFMVLLSEFVNIFISKVDINHFKNNNMYGPLQPLNGIQTKIHLT